MPVLLIRRKPVNRLIRQAAKNVYSQFGEDGMIQKIFEIIEPQSKFAVEFGASNGLDGSNTRLLMESGWSGIMIEGSPERFHALERNKPASVKTVNAYVRAEGPCSLDSLLKEVGCPSDIDLMSIDIDGNDYHVWKGLKDFAPRVVVIEFNPSIPNDVVYIQDYGDGIYQGSSLRALIELADLKGYALVAASNINAFFVQKSLYPRFGIENNDIDALYDQAQYASKIFQLYDGTVVVAGCDEMIWHGGVKMNVEGLQPFPSDKRQFPKHFR